MYSSCCARCKVFDFKGALPTKRKHARALTIGILELSCSKDLTLEGFLLGRARDQMLEAKRLHLQPSGAYVLALLELVLQSFVSLFHHEPS